MSNDNEDIIIYRQRDHVAESRKHFADYSRSKLIEILNQKVPHAPEHIAAKQLLDEMDKRDSDQKHQENMNTTKLTNRLSCFAIIIAILSLVVAIMAYVK